MDNYRICCLTIYARVEHGTDKEAGAVMDSHISSNISHNERTLLDSEIITWGAALPTPLAYRTPDEPIARTCDRIESVRSAHLAFG